MTCLSKACPERPEVGIFFFFREVVFFVFYIYIFFWGDKLYVHKGLL